MGIIIPKYLDKITSHVAVDIQTVMTCRVLLIKHRYKYFENLPFSMYQKRLKCRPRYLEAQKSIKNLKNSIKNVLNAY